MADVQQWRRKIQQARPRTPAAEKQEYVPDWPCWPQDEPFPVPDAERLMESIMCRLMSSLPNQTLDPRFNGNLLQIFESYRNLSDSHARLQSQLDEEALARKAIVQRLQQAQRQWATERQEYRAEVKRLEVLLAKGKRGLAEVTLARQASLIQHRRSQVKGDPEVDDGLQTIFEVLEKTKYEDNAYGSQRATFKKRDTSPSAEMRRLSQQLISKKSSLSDGTTSSFSYTGDLFPEESAVDAAFHSTQPDTVVPYLGQTLSAVRLHRRIDPELFTLQSYSGVYNPRSSSAQDLRSSSDRGAQGSLLSKQPSLIRKASEFFHRLRPALNVDTAQSASTQQRFSFEAGDDSEAMSSTTADNEEMMPEDRHRSESLSSLVELTHRALNLEHCPVEQSPISTLSFTVSPVEHSASPSPAHTASRRLTRIPTPVYLSGALSHPRRRREDSASSLLTAIRHSDAASTSGSASSSQYSSPTPGYFDTNGRLIVTDPWTAKRQNQRSTSSNSLLDHTNALRGNNGCATVPTDHANNHCGSASAVRVASAQTCIHVIDAPDSGSQNEAGMSRVKTENDPPMRSAK